ncbi:MAG: diacylglycerol kinase [Neisseriaceae bacterium]|nr:diacylglycerol kinase [Neisseriaceae bacterium]
MKKNDMVSEFKGKTGLRRLWYALGYSKAGLLAAYQHEAAFRSLVWSGVLLLPLALFLGQTSVEKALLCAVLLISLIVELLNSAIEAVVDRISLERHELSKRAKDMGSAAQLLAMVLVILTWTLILLPQFV